MHHISYYTQGIILLILSGCTPSAVKEEDENLQEYITTVEFGGFVTCINMGLCLLLAAGTARVGATE